MVLQPIISTPESLKQEDCHESGASLDYRAIQASLNCLERTEQTKNKKKKTKNKKPVIAVGLCSPFKSSGKISESHVIELNY